jgi:lipopolysaccharide/colanic/teichoic acid biosynthesis glycosyltransferase
MTTPAASSIYTRFGKRLLDVLASAIGLVFLSPLFAFVGCWITLDSPGSVFYRQIRVGKNGRAFRILKFRSMDSVASAAPAGITVSGDARVTRSGRFLRRFKIDELPQLYNVLSGEMSLVGPRPELPQYVALYSSDQKQVLSVRPGITDPASLAYRHEEDILSSSENPEAFYRNRVLPDKIDRNLAYIQTISCVNDLSIIFQTIFHSFLHPGGESGSFGDGPGCAPSRNPMRDVAGKS